MFAKNFAKQQKKFHNNKSIKTNVSVWGTARICSNKITNKKTDKKTNNKTNFAGQKQQQKSQTNKQKNKTKQNKQKQTKTNKTNQPGRAFFPYVMNLSYRGTNANGWKLPNPTRLTRVGHNSSYGLNPNRAVGPRNMKLTNIPYAP